jgi:hypothetical protein
MEPLLLWKSNNAFMEPLLLWKSNNFYITVCVLARTLMFVRVCVRTCVGALARACACARVALIIQHETRRQIVTCDLSGSSTFFDILS